LNLLDFAAKCLNLNIINPKLRSQFFYYIPKSISIMTTTTTIPTATTAVPVPSSSSSPPTYQCRRAKGLPKRLTTALEGDNDVWVERIVRVGKKARKRSIFQSIRTDLVVWDEPPSGASFIILENEIPFFGSSLQKYILVDAVPGREIPKPSWISKVFQKRNRRL
jgi:hypothetical protein